MSQRFYSKIRFVPDDCDEAFLVGRCIKVLHGFATRYEVNDVGIALPGWTEQSVGRELAFISNQKALINILLEQRYFQEMKEREYFDVSSLKVVEQQSEGEVILTRNQALGEMSASGQKRVMLRCKRRAEGRGEVYVPKTDISKNLSFEPFHRIPMSSKSSNRSFALYLQQRSVDKVVSGVFTSYGVSNKSGKVASVPSLLP